MISSTIIASRRKCAGCMVTNPKLYSGDGTTVGPGRISLNGICAQVSIRSPAPPWSYRVSRMNMPRRSMHAISQQTSPILSCGWCQVRIICSRRSTGNNSTGGCLNSSSNPCQSKSQKHGSWSRDHAANHDLESDDYILPSITQPIPADQYSRSRKNSIA